MQPQVATLPSNQAKYKRWRLRRRPSNQAILLVGRKRADILRFTRQRRFLFAFKTTITSELGLEEMQPERATANKQITAILNFRSIK